MNDEYSKSDAEYLRERHILWLAKLAGVVTSSEYEAALDELKKQFTS